MRLTGLYVITEPKLRDPVETARLVLAGGARILQLRDKHASTRQLVHIGRELRSLTRQYGATLIVNDRLDVALAIEADGVHLGQDDMPLPLARKITDENFLIGISAETLDEARQAEAEGANYLGVGPMFATATKPDAGAPVGPARLRAIKQAVAIPVFGIGGITLENAGAVLEAGADGICVISAIVGAADPQEATRRFLQMLG
ncbi:MAG: thiamine phosphate synthase [Fimbriimonadales bacterium]|nr:thiamine phosphate synthase [Fimbriimonadales bacterium]